MVVAEDLLVGVGDSDLVKDVDLKILPGYRYGIVGQNGVGKSTFLKILTGDLLPVHGSIFVDAKASVGYLKQTAVSGSQLSVEDEVKSQMHKLNAAKKELQQAELDSQADPSERNLLALEAAQEGFQNTGGYTVESRVSKVLSGLGFKPKDFSRKCSEFSGGWQMRIALARTLLSDPSLLLLDEPTNHLDSSAKNWLSGYLSAYEGTLMIVSHDENLLDRACNRILEIQSQKLDEYRCGLRQFRKERELRIQQQKAAYERQQEEIQKLEGFIEKFGAKATKASAAESRKKQLSKMDRIEAPTGKRKKPILKIPPPPPNDVYVAHLENATFGWNSEPLIKEGDWRIEKGERWVILGENGAGKSTLMAAMRGSLPLKSGSLYHSDRTVLGVFTQDLAQDLPQDKTALQHVLDTVQVAGGMKDGDGRAALGALGLSGPKALRRIGDLSGGEKARVALALLTLQPANLMLLDEVTNHLDAETVDVLCNALRKWSGSLAVITHDKSFAEKIAPTHVALVKKGGRVETHDGANDDDVGDGSTAATRQVDAHEQKRAREEENKLRKQVMSTPKKITSIEKKVEMLEEKLSLIDEQLAQANSEVELAMKLSEEREGVQNEVDGLYGEWEELEAFLAEHKALLPS
eukprot:jgi/Bigna1/57178/fgenesh1_pm.5_\